MLPPGIEIRLALLSDRERLAALPAARPFLDYPAILATAQAEMAAFLQFRHVASDELEVLQLFTREPLRRMGIAGALLRDLAYRFVSPAIYLEVRASNVAALQLYKRTGFFPVGIRESYYSDPVEDAIVLSLNVC